MNKKINYIGLCLVLYLQAGATTIDKDQFFGENRLFRDVMSGKFSKEITLLEQNKLKAIDAYKDALNSTGLELKAGVSDRLDSDFKGYRASVVWHLFKNGFLDIKKRKKEKV